MQKKKNDINPRKINGWHISQFGTTRIVNFLRPQEEIKLLGNKNGDALDHAKSCFHQPGAWIISLHYEMVEVMT
jgi:hypothetical protein